MRVIFILLLLQSVSISGTEKSRGGFRNDKSGFFTSIVNNSIEISLQIGLLRIKLKNAPRKSFNPFTDTKDDYREDIESNSLELKDYLSSTAKGEKQAELSLNSYNRSNKEVYEVVNAIKNTNDIIATYRRELNSNKSNLDKAKEYYTVQYECFVALDEMSLELIENIEREYAPNLINLANRLNEIKTKTEETIIELSDEADIATSRKLLVQQTKGLEGIQSALLTLEKQKAWAIERKKVFESKVKVTELALETAIVIKDAIGIINEVSVVLKSLQGESLPLLVFELDMKQFEM